MNDSDRECYGFILSATRTTVIKDQKAMYISKLIATTVISADK